MTLGNFNLPPAISGTHLGEWCDFVVNTVAMTFQIPGKKKPGLSRCPWRMA